MTFTSFHDIGCYNGRIYHSTAPAAPETWDLQAWTPFLNTTTTDGEGRFVYDLSLCGLQSFNHKLWLMGKVWDIRYTDSHPALLGYIEVDSTPPIINATVTQWAALGAVDIASGLMEGPCNVLRKVARRVGLLAAAVPILGLVVSYCLGCALEGTPFSANQWLHVPFFVSIAPTVILLWPLLKHIPTWSANSPLHHIIMIMLAAGASTVNYYIVVYGVLGGAATIRRGMEEYRRRLEKS